MSFETFLLWALVGAVAVLAWLIGKANAKASEACEAHEYDRHRIRELERKRERDSYEQKPTRVRLGFCPPCDKSLTAASIMCGLNASIYAREDGDPSCNLCKRTYTVTLTPTERRKKARVK